MDNAAFIAGYSLRLPFAQNSAALIENIKQGKRAEKKYWFASDKEANAFGLESNKYALAFPPGKKDMFDDISSLIEQALDHAGLDRGSLTGDKSRVYLTGLGARIDTRDYLSRYDCNDPEDLQKNRGLYNLRLDSFSQEKLASRLARGYGLSFIPPTLHCASNSALAGVHLGVQAIHSAKADLVMVVNYSQTRTQDICFMAGQGMLDGEIAQPFGEESRTVLPSDGCSVLILESGKHRKARGLMDGVSLSSVFTQIGASRGNDSAQLNYCLLKTITKAMAQSALSFTDLCAIIPHANGSETSDRAEAHALISLLNGCRIPVLAYKGQIGYVESGSGNIDLIIGHHTLMHGEILSSVKTSSIIKSLADYVPVDEGTSKHNKRHLLKVGLGVDGSVICIVMVRR